MDLPTTWPTLIIAALACLAVLVAAVAIAIWLDKRPQASWDRWYARINAFPSTKALVLLAMAMFFMTGLAVAIMAMYFAWTNKVPTAIYVDGMGQWLDRVLVFSGIGTIHFIGKRATTKPELEDTTPTTPAGAPIAGDTP